MKCDELKRFDIVGKYRDEETMYEFRSDGECYDADEVDAVIAELKAKLAKQDKELRRQKYKWCLAMADKCVDLCYKAKDLYRWAEDENLEHHYNRKIEFFARWHKRWRELAEKFKEGV